MPSSLLFPARHTRRDFLKLSTAAAAAAWIAPARAAEPVRMGEGPWTFTLDPAWGRLPEGMKFGYGCGIAVDGRGRIIVTTRSAMPAVAIFDAAGALIETWSDEFAEKVGFPGIEQVVQTAHGIYWSSEGGSEFLYFTENVAGGKDGQPRIGARVYKTDLQGRILFTLGNVASEDASHQRFDLANPTDVAVAPNGDIYVVDGYGSQRVSRFDKTWKHLKTIGAKGKAQNEFNTCHGVWIDTRKAEPEVYIADRGNSRVQVYSLELEFKRSITGSFLRNPCCFYQHDGHLYIPDLASMVTILDADDKPAATLGDGRDIPKAGMKATPEMDAPHAAKFFAPHALTLDNAGNLYVLEWVSFGRVRKFQRTPA
jgi:hypothetical protein